MKTNCLDRFTGFRFSTRQQREGSCWQNKRTRYSDICMRMTLQLLLCYGHRLQVENFGLMAESVHGWDIQSTRNTTRTHVVRRGCHA